MTYKPSKVLIIGQFYCHSERSEESRGGVIIKIPTTPIPFTAFRVTTMQRSINLDL
jgi:hypothetical protein